MQTKAQDSRFKGSRVESKLKDIVLKVYALVFEVENSMVGSVQRVVEGFRLQGVRCMGLRGYN